MGSTGRFSCFAGPEPKERRVEHFSFDKCPKKEQAKGAKGDRNEIVPVELGFKQNAEEKGGDDVDRSNDIGCLAANLKLHSGEI